MAFAEDEVFQELDWPMKELPVLLVLLVSAVVAGQINRAIYRWAWRKRSISPWSQPPQGVNARSYGARLPVVGWWWMRAETAVHGRRFWLRPLCIELAFAAAMAWLYVFELRGGLQPSGAGQVPLATFVVQYPLHYLLASLLTIATFIDLDEQTIPDRITLPGSVLALLASAVWPACRLAGVHLPADDPLAGLDPALVEAAVAPLTCFSPAAWDPAWDGTKGLGVAVFCLVGWWYAFLPKTLWYRSGWRSFFRYLVASAVRDPRSAWLTAGAAALLAGTVACWQVGGEHWRSLLSAWVGLAAGGGIVWSVRIVGSLALGQEAMGFGDVTFLAMIGAFLGWQAALLVFFMSPFAGMVIAVAQWILTGRKDIAFGPFLALAAAVVVVTWPTLWLRWGVPIFSLGSFVPLVLACSLLLLGVLLVLVRRMRMALFPDS